MLHKCPVCEQQTQETYYDENQNIPFYICQNDECPSNGKQMTNIEVNYLSH